ERGAAEGRDPHPLFDTTFYLERHPEAGGAGLNPLVHYLRIGAARGYVAVPPRPARRLRPDRVPRRRAALVRPPPSLASRVTLVSLGSGPGPGFPACATAINAAAAAGRGDYLLLVDGSLDPPPAWIEPLLEGFALLPYAGALCATVDHHAQGRHPRPVPGLSARGVLLPRELFGQLGGLAPHAPCYGAP